MNRNPRKSGHRASPRRSPRRGLILVEVLAALAIIAIVLPVVAQGVTLALRNADRAKRSADASALAEAKMNELVTTGNWQNGVLSGDFKPDSPDFSWTAQAISRDSDLTLVELDVDVSWTSGGTESSVGLSTFVYPETQ